MNKGEINKELFMVLHPNDDQIIPKWFSITQLI